MTWHEPKCETCGTFDADCDCTLRWGKRKDCGDTCTGCEVCGPLPIDKDWPMPKPPPYPADDEATVYAGMGNHELLSEAYTHEGARLIEVQRLKDTMSFDHLADLYLTLTDGIVRERLLRRTAEHKLYAIKTMVNLLD